LELFLVNKLFYDQDNASPTLFYINAESGETKGTAKEEEGLEKKFLAPKARGHSTIAWPN
jgi:hypothetical protein